MATDGEDFATNPTGTTAFGKGSDGRVYPVAVDPTTGRMLVSTDDTPSDTATTVVRTAADALRELSAQDSAAQTLVWLRVIARLLAAANEIPEADLQSMISDEMASVGL
jgi:hypothetical protein